MANKLPVWEDLTTDDVILSYISGYEIEFESQPFQRFIPRQYRLEPKHKSVLQLQIDDLVTREVVTEVEGSQDDFVSNVFLREKSNGKFRMIVDLSELNKCVKKIHFKMDSFTSVLDLLHKDAFLTSVDLKDAYHSVPIFSNHRKFLTFLWEGRFFRFNVLPFGLTSAPRVFTKILKPVLASLREEGISCLAYIDDCLIVSDSFDEAGSHCTRLCDLLLSLGFSINYEKSSLVPSKAITFLGYQIDTTVMMVSPTQDKIDKTLDKIENILQKGPQKIREVARVIGTLVDLCKGVEYGAGHIRSLEKDKVFSLQRAGDRGFEGSMWLTKEAKEDLQWWRDSLPRGRRKIRSSAPSETMFTDASLEGWGAVSDGTSTGGRWTPSELGDHINVLELRAILLGLQSFHRNSRNLDILVKSDNTTAVAYVNNMGGMTSSECSKVARTIWEFCEKRKLWILATYIPGVDNEEADFMSRHFSDDTEWELAQDIFDHVTDTLGSPSVDLFASRLNAKLPCYVSWKKDPKAWQTNAFALNWSELKMPYIFPPFRLVGRVIQKLREDEASAILVAPDWPGQFWYGLLKRKHQRDLMFFRKRQGNLVPVLPRLEDSPIADIPLVVAHFCSGR